MTDKNVKVSERTFEALKAMQEVRGATMDRIIRDMLESFAPFLADTVYHQDMPNVHYGPEGKEHIVTVNKSIGARAAYADFWRRIEEELTCMEEDPGEDVLRKRMKEYERLKEKGII